MRFLPHLLLATLPLLTLGEEAIMSQGDVLEPRISLRTGDGACRLTLQRDGNLVARRRGPYWPKPATSDPIPESISWKSGSRGSGDYFATLTTDGNLQVIRRGTNNQVVFSTHVFAPTNGTATHELVFTDKCALLIMRHSGADINRVWTNIHGWLDNFSADEYPGLDNVLTKGEFFTYPGQNYGQVCGTGANFCMNVPFSLRLQQDCNLVTFVGHDFGDAAAVVWSAGVAQLKPSDCYLLVESNNVALYKGSFDPTLPTDSARPGKYWSIPSSFFDVDGYRPGMPNWYQVLINNEGNMYLDWD